MQIRYVLADFELSYFFQNKNSLELLNIIFENDSLKGSFGANKKKVEFSLLSPDSRKLLTTSLNSLRWLIYPINSVYNTKLPCYTLPPTQPNSYLRKSYL